ncbi:FUSC family protein [Nocardioides pantholopis]|uniref:FUSC family protein n=1 Tax=Nocardioides pantholopis TaxID=2483798 RepID=UPI000F07BB67|nr:FUSC family protein [Nocardioides pantholopis]
MDSVWLVLGIVVLLATLLDVFLTALNYDEAGFLAGPVARLQWHTVRRVTRRLPRRWRPVALRQVTGLQIIVIVAVWLFGVILGYGLIYRGLMSPTSFSVSGTGAERDFFDAMYFSAAQLSTVGGSVLTAETDLLRFLSIAETLTGVILVSLILTFLLGVYDVIGSLHSLCRHFFSAERGAGSPVASLAPYFQQGEPNGLDGHVDGIADSFASYTDGLRLHHAAYYFQSGRDQFALPYALRMTGGTLGALRWGLPTGHPATTQPALVGLTFQFLEFGDYLHTQLRWRSVAVPEVVTPEVFARLAKDERRAREDSWVARFVQLEREMAGLAGLEPLSDLDDAHRRYSAWLPFAYRAQQIVLATSADLDYQPVIVSDTPVSILEARDAVALQSIEEIPGPVSVTTDPVPDTERSRAGRLRTFLDEHLSLVDPGHARLRSAARAVLGAVAAVVTLHPLFDALDETALPPAIFGGFVAMLSAGVAVDRTVRGRQVTSVLVVLPVSAVVLVGALASGSALWSGVLLVVIALVGVGAGRLGPRWAALGRVSFMAYYFALIMRLELADVVFYIAAAVVGVAWAYVLNHLVLPDRPRRVLRGGIDGLGRRLVDSMDPLIDAVSWARWDPDIRKRVSADLRQLHGAAAFIGGQLSGEPAATGIDPASAAVLRLRLFDLELTSGNLTGAVRDVTGTAISLELRARLAGRLELLQAHLQEIAARPVEDDARPTTPTPSALAPWSSEPAPTGWPLAARALHHAADEVYLAADALQRAEAASLDPAAPPLADPGVTADDGSLAEIEELEGVAQADPETPAPRSLSGNTKQAVQAAAATGAALLVGEAVSSTHQYWATLSAYQVLGGTDGETFVKGAKRIAGTVVGAAVGFAIAIGTDAEPAVVVPLLAVAVFASTYYRPVSPAVSTFWVTMIFAMIYETLGRLSPVALELRVLETLFGAVVALLVAWWVFPTHTRTKLNQDLTSLLDDLRVVITAGLERLSGNDTVSAAAIRRRLLAINQAARQLTVTSAPLRRAAGALEAGGVEGRLTAVWSLTYYTRRLIEAVEHALAAGVDPGGEDWGQLRRATSDNLTALTAALADQLPGPVHDSLPASRDYDPSGRPTRPEDAVLRELERINQTVVLLLGDISPGAVNRDAEPAATP